MLQPGVVTGKPVEIGGSLGRVSATGLGVVYVAEKKLSKIGGKPMGSAKLPCKGFVNGFTRPYNTSAELKSSLSSECTGWNSQW